MMNHTILSLIDYPEKKQALAQWFHERWGAPLEAYLESMEECLRNTAAYPQWYVAVEGETIIGGLGVIHNDFHDRKDLYPNVCAVYTEPAYRGQGVAGALLSHVCGDMHRRGVDTLYLVTDHMSFYERYGWEFHCMAQGDGEDHLTRLYIHRMG